MWDSKLTPIKIVNETWLPALPTSKLTIYEAAALHLPTSVISVEYKCRTKCDKQCFNCIKSNMKYIQYCHTRHQNCGHLHKSLAKQIEIPIIHQTQKPIDHLQRICLALTPRSKQAKKRVFVDWTAISPDFAKCQDLRLYIPTLLAM